ncbi:MAG: hypothetical protein PHP64_03450 [Actinomycetota bacterium]|nr:hypothetical protein [Actinomycetota bacterium]
MLIPPPLSVSHEVFTYTRALPSFPENGGDTSDIPPTGTVEIAAQIGDIDSQLIHLNQYSKVTRCSRYATR